MVVYLFNSGANSGSFFERRGRKGFAKCAEEDKRKYKMNSKKEKTVFHFLNFGIFLVFSFLRSLRNLRALCVQKFFGILYSAAY
jgi:hypothetical protein